MNWNKVLNVFLMMFLVINIFLYSYQQIYEANRYTLSSKRIAQLESVLNSKAITHYVYLPSYYPKSQIELEAPSIDKEYVAKRVLGDHYESKLENENPTVGERLFNENESLTFYVGEQKGLLYYKGENSNYIPKDLTDASIDDTVLRFAGDVFGEDVKMAVTTRIKLESKDNASGKGYKLELNEVYGDDVIIFQTYIKLIITENGIEEALAIRYKPIDYIGVKKNIYPYDEVMYSLVYYLEEEYDESLLVDEGKNRTVLDIDIGYYLVDDDSRKLVYQLDPYYRVIFANGAIYYINAYTNDIFKP